MKIKSQAIKQAISLIGLQSNTVTVESDETGWHLKAIDPSRVSLSKVDITLGAFEDYAVWDQFTMDVSGLDKALKDKGDKPEFSLNAGMLTIRGDNMTTKVRLLTPEESVRGVPDLDLGIKAVFSSTYLKKIVKVLPDDQMSMRITATEDAITLEGYNEDGAGSSVSIPSDQCEALVGVGGAVYPLSMCKGIAGAIPNDTQIEVGLDTDMPIVIKYEVSSAEFTWVCAPWVESED